MSDSVRDILNEYIAQKGRGGLLQPDLECGCELGDLIPCDCNPEDCLMAFRIANPDNPSQFIMSLDEFATYENLEHALGDEK